MTRQWASHPALPLCHSQAGQRHASEVFAYAKASLPSIMLSYVSLTAPRVTSWPKARRVIATVWLWRGQPRKRENGKGKGVFFSETCSRYSNHCLLVCKHELCSSIKAQGSKWACFWLRLQEIQKASCVSDDPRSGNTLVRCRAEIFLIFHKRAVLCGHRWCDPAPFVTHCCHS